MKKLGWLILVVALLILMLPASQALAHPMPGERIRGVITAIDAGAGTFTLNVLGDEVLVQTSPKTRFIRMLPGGGMEPITFDDLVVGDRVKAMGAWQGDVFYAIRVLVKSRLS